MPALHDLPGWVVNRPLCYHLASTTGGTASEVIRFTHTNASLTSNNTVIIQENRCEGREIFKSWVDFNAAAWSNWHTVTGNTVADAGPPRWWNDAHWGEETAEQRQRAEEAARRIADAEYAKVKAVRDRATELLLTHLNEEQRRCLNAQGFFYVAAPGSGRLYRIDRGMHGNVKVVDPRTKAVIEVLCIQPDGVPAEDAMLVQKLQIEIDEERFRRAANITEELTRRTIHRAEPIFLPAGERAGRGLAP